jgi:putative ABC transport system permease protein
MVWDRKVLVPLTSFDLYLGRDHAGDRLFVRLPPGARGAGRIAPTERLLASLLRRLHLGVSNFAFAGKDGFVQQERLIAAIIRMLMICTGVLALFAGGLNIGNIMLIAVGERTREIGIRRALGATARSIELQFLGEAALLASVGGLVGVGLATLGIELCGLVLGRLFGAWTVHVEGWSIALGLGLAALTGVGFGVMPARRAARLEPVAALRAE